uniref:Beta-defensin n=1 Tax=Ailuropoda melanoleuca TaxID=9646 RepID=A0A7N5JMV3_AILME
MTDFFGNTNLAIPILLYTYMRSEFDTDKICGYGTAHCRRTCKTEEFQIGGCPNVYPCCLKKRTPSLSKSNPANK